ncbi:hypothetical protein N2152v2_010340 [Parachlorella kessleri]
MEEGLQPAVLEMSESTKDFVAGGIAGMCGVAAGAPLDIVRVRQQQASQAAVSALKVLRDIMAREGKFSLFKGLAYPLYTASFQNAVVFHSYGTATRYTNGVAAIDSSTPLPYHQVFMAGSFAGAVQTAIQTPVDVLKIRLQLQRAVPGMPGYKSPLGMLQHVLATEGLTGLYRGTIITGIRDIPSYGVYYSCFELCRELMDGSRETRSSSPLTLWAAGGLAGIISWCSVYAFDVVKSRIQATSAQASRYRGWVDCAWQSYQQEGPRVFFKGFSTTLSRAFLVNGAIFTMYELSHKALMDREEQRAS